MEAVIIFGMLFLMLALGIPIAFSLGLTSIAYICMYDVVDLVQMPTKMFISNDSYIFLAIPLFIFTGYLMESGGISTRLVDFVQKALGRIPGSLGSVAVVVCMIFAAITGSGVATVAAVGSIMYPLMVENGYRKDFAAGLIAASGALGTIIPPSIPMVVYGGSQGVSVADLFIGGVIPGIMMGCTFIAVNTVYAIKNKLPRTTEKYSAGEILKSLWKGLPILFLPVMILGGIYGGILTPTEAATFAVIYSFLLSLCLKTLKWQKFRKTCMKTVITSGVIMAIINISNVFAFIMTLEAIPQIIADAVMPYMHTPSIYLGILVIFLLIVGALMDTAPAILILAPVLVPIGTSMGLNPVFLGIVFCVTLSVGLMTPPFGLTLFTIASTARISFEEVVKGIWWFIGMAFVVVLVMTFCEPLTMALID